MSNLPPEYPPSPPLGPPPPPVPPGGHRPPPIWPGDDAPEAGPTRRPTWVVAGAIVAVLALVAALFAVFLGERGGDEDGVGQLEAVDDAPATTTGPAADESTTTVPAEADDFDSVRADIEGDAERVALAYEATFTAAEAAEAAAEELSLGLGFDFDAIPAVLINQLVLPYVLGPDLVAEILGAGGQAALDGSFAAPPTTSEHLLEPETFVGGDPPNPVADPAADGEVFDQGVLGLLELAELAGEIPLLGGTALPDEVDGWGGDRYVAWHDGDRTCVRVALLGETIQDTDEYEELLTGIAADPPGGVDATVVTGAGPLDPVLYTSCG